MKSKSSFVALGAMALIVLAGPALAQSIDLSPVQTLLQGIVDDGDDGLQVDTRSDLRHHAAVAAMQVCLRGDDIGQDPAPADDNSCRRLVTGRLDAKDHPVMFVFYKGHIAAF